MSLAKSRYPVAQASKGPLARAASRVFGSYQSADSQIARTPEDIAAMIRAQNESAAGIAVNDANSLRVGAVYACVNLLAGSIAMLPQGVFRRPDVNTRVLAPEHPVHMLIARRPNSFMTAFEYKRLQMTWLLMRGNFYAYKLRSASNKKLQELIPIHPDKMIVERAADGTPVYKSRRADGGTNVYKPGDIHHIKLFSVDGLAGYSVISAAMNSIGTAVAAERFAARLYRNGAKPSGVLKHPATLSDEAAERLKADIESQVTGDNAHKLLLLEEGLTFEPISLTPEEAQFIESRKFTRGEIAMFFAVPPHMIGDIDRGTSWGTGIEQQGLGFVTYTIGSHLKNIAEAEARDFFTDTEALSYEIDFNTTELTRADFLTRQQGLQIQRANGVISPDEWRAAEGLNPRPDGGGTVYSAPGTAAASPPAQPALPSQAAG